MKNDIVKVRGDFEFARSFAYRADSLIGGIRFYRCSCSNVLFNPKYPICVPNVLTYGKDSGRCKWCARATCGVLYYGRDAARAFVCIEHRKRDMASPRKYDVYRFCGGAFSPEDERLAYERAREEAKV